MEIRLEYAVTIFVAIFACDGFWSYVRYRFEKKDAKTKAILALLHDKIYYLCEKHILSGAISVDELDNLTYLYGPYKEMGGNGTCEHLYNECKKLKVKE